MHIAPERRRALDVIHKAQMEFIRLAEELGREALALSGKIDFKRKTAFNCAEESVTELDIKNSEKLINALRRYIPGTYSEEHFAPFDERVRHNVLCFIDPIDGTDEFIAGLKEHFSILASFFVQDEAGRFEPVAAVIHIPGREGGLTWYNNVHTGELCCDKQGVRQRFSPLATLRAPSEVIRVGVRGLDLEKGPERMPYLQKLLPFLEGKGEFKEQGLSQILGRKVEIGIIGSAGSMISDILEGRVDLIIINYQYSKEWDAAPGVVLLESAGGYVCKLNGEPHSFNKKEPLITGGSLVSLKLPKGILLRAVPSSLLV